MLYEKDTPTPMQASTILVTGASGYVGSRVLAKLATTGKNFVAICRHRTPELPKTAVSIHADLLSKDTLQSSLRGAHTVLHLAWDRKPNTSKDSPLLDSPNIICMRNLVEAMEVAGVQRMIFISTAGVEKSTSIPFLKEKYICEQILINSRIPEKIIIRPSMLYGGDSLSPFVLAIKNVIRSKIFYPIPQTEQRVAPLHVDDLAELVVRCTELKMYDFCTILNLVGGESYKAAEIFRIIALRLNTNLFPLGSFFGSAFIKLIEKKTAKNQWKIEDYFAIGNCIEKNAMLKNPVAKILPEKCQAFHESFSLDGSDSFS